MSRNLRIIKSEDQSRILYIKHLGTEPYNEVKFECGRKLIVSYSLNFWQNIFQDFQRINRGVLVNPTKIISQTGLQIVILKDNSEFNYSRRKFKNALIEQSKN
jgi:DNA-binding LytR/AlgR family response regulator